MQLSSARCVTCASYSVCRDSTRPVATQMSLQFRSEVMHRRIAATSSSPRHASAHAVQVWAQSKHASIAAARSSAGNSNSRGWVSSIARACAIGTGLLGQVDPGYGSAMSPPIQTPLPAVLRSLQALVDEGVDVLPAGARDPIALPIAADGTTYAMAQEAAWLDGRHFAVGRWDGSFSVFAWGDSAVSGSLISVTASDPSSEGVQMVCSLGARSFATSCGESQIAAWAAPDGSWRSLEATYHDYDPAYGAANSATVVEVPAAGARYLVVGHAGGWATSWSYVPGEAPALAYAGSVDVRGEDPVNPWNLHNVRSVQALRENLVVTGSEDGYISIVDVGAQAVLSQTVYNPAAQRGINSMALGAGGALLVANCSVGPDDSNLWYFEIDDDARPQPRDHINLKVDPRAPQAFNFYTTWAQSSSGPCWFCSTQEGALWMGTASGQSIETIGYQRATNPLGAALAYRAGRLVLAGHDLYEFKTGG